MTLHPEDGKLVRAVAERVEKANARERAVRVALNLLVAASLVAAAGFGAWAAWEIRRVADRNEIGVARIVDCTTPGRPCYEEQQERTNRLIAEFLIDLNREHLVLRCTLDVLPANRSDETDERCEAEADRKTQERREELARKIAEAQKQATTTTTRR